MQQDYTPHFMGDLKSVLLCTDGSDYSAGAIKAAINLARECRTTKLTVLRVLEFNPEFETEGQKHADRIENEARAHLEAVREAAAEENVECEGIVRRNDRPYQAIVDEAVRRQADVIVMGRRGMTGLRKMLMGSVTARVVGHAPCKVLVVPKDAVMRGERILLATDGSPYSEAAEHEIITMGKRCPHIKGIAALSVASSGDTQEQARATVERVVKRAEEEGIAIEPLTAVGRPQDAIVDAVRQKNIDMVVMGTHGRTGMEKLLMGSISERVVGLSPAAILVIKSKSA
ncbi:MAG: universal stress protein [Alphaproteobacteria bacterium]|uniref:Universal stress protein n=1 Tax=Candidatus Nitrobium versatile TaxID=2884831 RepID=A0A953LX48_9BACT|nr:universal stress protein [Candidatus Nitrobium versatile]